MNYLAQSQMIEDNFLINRVAAAAAHFGVKDARSWAVLNMWLISASEGWATKYGEASNLGEDPAAWAPVTGLDPKIITDEMITEAVKRVIDQAKAAEQSAAEEASKATAEAMKLAQAETERAAHEALVLQLKERERLAQKEPEIPSGSFSTNQN